MKHWIADIAAALCLFFMLAVMFVFGYAAQPNEPGMNSEETFVDTHQ